MSTQSDNIFLQMMTGGHPYPKDGPQPRFFDSPVSPDALSALMGNLGAMANNWVANTPVQAPVVQAQAQTATQAPVVQTQALEEVQPVSQQYAAPTMPLPTTQMPTRANVANYNPMNFGNGNYVIPSGDYTANGITVNAVTPQNDNGGLSHAAMNILHQTNPASFGQALAFANLMQGHRGLSGGIGDMTKTMQDIDKANAFQLQGQVAGRVQDLMGQGYGTNEARFIALTEAGQANGLDRMAVGTTLPEYTKYADERAKRDLETAMALGGAYEGQGAFGYTPLGIQGIMPNGNNSADVQLNNQAIRSVPTEFLNNGVYAALTGGKGSGINNSAKYYRDNLLADYQAQTGTGKMGSRGLSYEERLALEEAKAENRIKVEEAKSNLKSGGKGTATGVKFTPVY